MKHSILILVLALLKFSFLCAQYEYEPNDANPYGLPNPKAPSEIKEYEQMIGICDCKSSRAGSDGKLAEPVSMIWEFKYIMNGMGVQDFTLKEDGTHSGSIRQFNPEEQKWYVHYYSSANPASSLGTWEGGKIGNDIVLLKSQKAPNGMEGNFRITFKDISEKGFNWTGEWVSLDESIEFLSWKIDCLKRQE